MSRVALFTALLAGGVLLFESMGVLVKEEAWLAAALIAAVLLFYIPQSGKTRGRQDLIFYLLSAVAIYAIFLKFRPWFADTAGQWLATVVSALLVLIFAGVTLLLPAMRRSNGRIDNGQ